jgi:Ca2+:H+ antiporter
MGIRDRFQREQRVAHAGDPQANGGAHHPSDGNGVKEKPTDGHSNSHTNGNTNGNSYLPTHNGQAEKQTSRGIQPDGESGRRGIHPWKFLKTTGRSASTLSAMTNVLWPFVPAAIVLHFVGGDHHVWTFATAYIGMVPAASLLGFAGQEFVGYQSTCV